MVSFYLSQKLWAGKEFKAENNSFLLQEFRLFYDSKFSLVVFIGYKERRSKVGTYRLFKIL